jgi:nucleoside-diphosphate-sugar epimerase
MYAHKYRNQTILVTGGAGFIGSHLVEALVHAGAHVTVLDNFSSGSLDNLKAVQDKITIINESVTDLDSCLKASQGKAFIFHLAAMVSVPESLSNPLACHAVNTTGTATILEAARINAVPTLVFASSSAVYGPVSGLCHEKLACNPASPYGYSKYMGEFLCKQYAELYNIKTIAVRYFNVYGNRQSVQGPYAGVVAQFKNRMTLGQPITIFGDGCQRRDFIPVADVVNATLFVALMPTADVHGEVFNIATGTSITINDLFKLLRSEFPDYTLNPFYAPARAGDIYSSQADCSKYQRLLENVRRNKELYDCF